MGDRGGNKDFTKEKMCFLLLGGVMLRDPVCDAWLKERRGEHTLNTKHNVWCGWKSNCGGRQTRICIPGVHRNRICTFGCDRHQCQLDQFQQDMPTLLLLFYPQKQNSSSSKALRNSKRFE
jgi:hypothetical protein